MSLFLLCKMCQTSYFDLKFCIENICVERFDLYSDQTLTLVEPSLKDLMRAFHEFLNVTAKVCKYTCQKIHATNCNTALYDRNNKTCTLLIASVTSQGIRLTPRPGQDIYAIHRCGSKLFRSIRLLIIK